MHVAPFLDVGAEKRHATRRLRGAVREALHRGTERLPVRTGVPAV